MSKTLIGALALLAALAVAASALAAQTAGVQVKVNPAKAGTAKKARGVALDVITTAGDDTGAQPSATTRAVIRYQKGFKFNASKFPTCAKADLDAGRTAQCSDAKVGSGSATINAGLLGNIAATVTAYNGANSTLLLYVVPSGASPQTLVATLRNQPTGPYGYALTVTVPPPPVPGAAITRFQVVTLDKTITKTIRKRVRRRGRVRVQVRRVVTHYIEAPTFCQGSWQFAGEFTYANGQSLTATDTVACARR